MLTQDQLNENKLRFLQLVEKLRCIEGAKIDLLLDYLNNSDFFTAPASTIYHCDYAGGLCLHSLNVYDSICSLVTAFGLEDRLDPTSLIIVSLFHDISKINHYEKYIKNEKIYSPEGKQYDNMGKYSWVSSEAFKVKDVKERFLAGDHGFNSFFILSKYIPLMDEEIIAIINHHCGMDTGNPLKDLSAILSKNPLAVLLHMADFISCYIKEN